MVTGRIPAKSTTDRPSGEITMLKPPPPAAFALGVLTVYPSDRQAPTTHGGAPVVTPPPEPVPVGLALAVALPWAAGCPVPPWVPQPLTPRARTARTAAEAGR